MEMAENVMEIKLIRNRDANIPIQSCFGSTCLLLELKYYRIHKSMP